jgi:cobalamin biosynthetic protein CobC
MASDTAAIGRAIETRKAGLDAVLSGAGLKVVGGTGLFSLVEHEEAHALHDALCRRHVLVRPFDYNRRWLRFGLAPDEAGDARLSAALAGATG